MNFNYAGYEECPVRDECCAQEDPTSHVNIANRLIDAAISTLIMLGVSRDLIAEVLDSKTNYKAVLV